MLSKLFCVYFLLNVQALCFSFSGFGQTILRLGQQPFASNDRYLIELQPGETRWVSELEKWELKRQGINFMDITERFNYDVSASSADATVSKSVSYPSKPAYNDTLQALLPLLNKTNLENNLENFSSFHTRYYKSEYGAESSRWLLSLVNATIYAEAGNSTTHAVTVDPFEHSWGQASIIARIPGQTNKTIVIGAHQDSINLFLPSVLPAPGADDDGSGTVTILEAFRVVLMDEDLRSGNAENTLEFHWYSAEEGGLLGSQAIFQAYETQGRDVRAMLQQDMTGYIQGTLDDGKEESVGVITDYVDENLTEFIKMVVDEYCTIPYVLTKCGYACSDHASASKAGYPSAFVIESDFPLSNKKIHTMDDKAEYLSFDHMLQHARLTTAFAYELAFAKLD